MTTTKKVGFKVPSDFPQPRTSGVIIKPCLENEKSHGGLIMATSQSTNKSGIIYAVGSKVEDLEPGMKVQYHFMENTTIIHKGENYLIMHENAVLVKLAPDDILITEGPTKKQIVGEKRLAEQAKFRENEHKEALNKMDKSEQQFKKKTPRHKR